MFNMYILVITLICSTSAAFAAADDVKHNSIVAYCLNKQMPSEGKFQLCSQLTEDNFTIVVAYTEDPNVIQDDSQDHLADIAQEFVNAAEECCPLIKALNATLYVCNIPKERYATAFNITCIVLTTLGIDASFTDTHPNAIEPLMRDETLLFSELPGTFFFFNEKDYGKSGKKSKHKWTAQEKANLLQEAQPERLYHVAVNIDEWLKICENFGSTNQKITPI